MKHLKSFEDNEFMNDDENTLVNSPTYKSSEFKKRRRKMKTTYVVPLSNKLKDKTIFWDREF